MRAALILLLLAGCSGNWPPAGQGGMAEAHWPAPLLDPLAPPALEARLRCTLAWLDATDQEARRVGTHSGAVALLELTANRVRREYAGGFYQDAVRTLDRLEVEVDQFRAELGLPTAEACA
jgi:hypothetical protein